MTSDQIYDFLITLDPNQLAKALLKFETGSLKDGVFEALLRNTERDFFFYGMPYGHLRIRIETRDGFNVFLHVASIDDDSIPVFGPNETSEKAKLRFDRTVKHVQENWNGLIPTVEQVQALCKDCGLWWNR